MVAQQVQQVEVELGARRGRFVEVIADGRRVGSVEWDHGDRWIAHVPDHTAVWFTDQGEAAAFVAETFAGNLTRWQAALERAVADGLDPMEISGKWGAWAVESGSRPGVVYLVEMNGASCSCKAGAAGQVCKHKACVRFAAGLLAVYGLEVDADPDPEPPAAVCEVTGRPIAADGFFADTCRSCAGLGRTWFEWGRSADSRTCEACGGTGLTAA